MNNRILGIVGSVLLIVGIFLPVVSGPSVNPNATSAADAFGDTVSYSYFSTLTSGGGFSLGILCAVLGLVSLALIFTRKYKLLVATGGLALAILALDFFVSRSKLGEIPAEMMTAMGDKAPGFVWVGWLVLALGAILVLLAGIMKNNEPAPGAAWGSAPPPPPPYTPGR
ncbi:MAG TPA: hypothetical protein VGC87_01025 [Pyrinomonadaceae bacterium]|jgi:hypothetical protein